MSYVLVLYYSQHGSISNMAQVVARGVNRQLECRLRTVPEVSPTNQATSPSIPERGAPFATQDDLAHCQGLILGSPTHFGNMAAPLKYFLDQTSDLWLSGTLVDKPAAAFTASASMHGGQEATLLTMCLPLLHHGMVYVGLPYTETALTQTQTGGTPYGASHVSSSAQNSELSTHEKALCLALGERVARMANKLAPSPSQS